MFYDIERVNDLLESNSVLKQYKDELINNITENLEGYLIMNTKDVHCVIDITDYSIVEGAVNTEIIKEE